MANIRGTKSAVLATATGATLAGLLACIASTFEAQAQGAMPRWGNQKLDKARACQRQIAKMKRIDRTEAVRVMPYALASSFAYNDRSNAPAPGFKRDVNWTAILRRARVGKSLISMYENAGFSAAIYRDGNKKEIIIAYRGTEIPEHALQLLTNASRRDAFLKDFSTDVRARFVHAPSVSLDPQYVAGVALAKRITDENWGYTISLTGHSLGGAVASYAGHWIGAYNVVTFNAARNPYSTIGNNPNQINIIVSADMVGDPRRKALGEGCLPGTYVTVPTTTPQNMITRHSIQGIIGGLISVNKCEICDMALSAAAYAYTSGFAWPTSTP